jgi:uncharacterized hydrophobic protein (TIGR00271 family)
VQGSLNCAKTSISYKMSETNDPSKALIGGRLIEFLRGIFALDDINYKQSIGNIKTEVAFKGFNIWILICSILVCSLGLNMNSTAVVIGAMLISPLMGPIVGLGLGIGIYDSKLIFRALKNLGVAAGISILTAFVFFRITPTEVVPEILARTKPTVLDLFVAFFGGVAGILAASRCISTNVVPGVAIATALMPPLCTAGFGLASGNWDYFAGAFYLFLMNTIMISVAALLVTLYLRYPKFSFVNQRQKTKVKTGIIVIVVLVSVPSIWFYYNVLEQNFIERQVERYIEEEIQTNPAIYVTNQSFFHTDTGLVIRLNINGDYLEKEDIVQLQEKINDYGISGGVLEVTQPQPLGFKEQRLSDLKMDIIKELYQNSEVQLDNKDDEIALLKSEIQRITTTQMQTSNVTAISKTQYDIEEIGIDVIVYTKNEKKDTITTALVDWKPISKAKKKEQEEKLAKLIKLQLAADKVRVIELN